jgi:isopenicillin N synthase-like dioxygenase
VNLGELMARWTNDRFTATPHRVTHPDDATETRPRTSAPFFLKPNHDAVVAPIAELLSSGEEPRYAPVTGRDWVKQKQESAYAGYDATARFTELAAGNPLLQ